MNKFREFQFSYLITIFLVIFLVWMTFAWYYQWGNSPLETKAYVLFLLVFALVLINLYGLTTRINEKEIIVKFGIGLITRKISLMNIQSAKIITYPVWYGYGIRITPAGWLYNVGGRQAVELKIKGEKNRILIGTMKPQKLLQAILTSKESSA